MTILQNLIDDANAVLALVESEGRDTGMGDAFSDLRDAIAAATAHSAPKIPMIHNKGTENEVTLRVVLASDACGNEYFDSSETLDEALESVKGIVLNCLKGTPDAFDRVVGIAVVPKEQYGAEDGFGYGLSPDYSDSVSDKGGFAFFDDHEDSDACNSFMDDTALGIDDDGYVLDGDDERMTYKAFQDYDCGF